MTIDIAYIIGPVAASIITGGVAIRTNHHVNAVREEVKTNHGKRNGEYIEEIHAKMGVLATALTDHTLDDTRHFTELSRLIGPRPKLKRHWARTAFALLVMLFR